MRRWLGALCMLAAVLAFAGYLRFTGQNWDDYSHSHPDERFLTALLLPGLGGSNTYTQDNRGFPPQDALVSRDNPAVDTMRELTYGAGFRIGALSGSFAQEAAGWLVDSNRVDSFGDAGRLADALNTGRIDVAIASPSVAQIIDAAETLGTLDSRQLQDWRCRSLYPDSDGVGGYFDARCSSLNPHQAGHGFYVYGAFPLLLAHFTGEVIREFQVAEQGFLSWQGYHLAWRALSAVFDMLTVVMIFALGTRLHGRGVGLMAALLYAAAPLAIQKAHFGTTNAIAASMTTLALYFAVVVQQRGRMSAYMLFGVACGAAVASRPNLAPLAGIVVAAALVRAAPVFDSRLERDERIRIALTACFGLCLAGLATFLAFRLLNPYTFTGPGFFDLTPNPRWLENVSAGSAGVTGHQDWPPTWQWMSRAAYVYPMKDMLLWAMGLPLATLAWFGWGWSCWRVLRFKTGALAHLPLILWVGCYFVWMNQVFPMTMRYYLPLYSALVTLAALAIARLYSLARESGADLPITRLLLLMLGGVFATIGGAQIHGGIIDATAATALALGIGLILAAVLPFRRGWRALTLGGFALVFTCVWGLMFGNVYRHQTTLVQSSRYLFAKAPGNFAMRVADAPESAPLINLGFYRSPHPALDASSLFNNVTTIEPGGIQSLSFTAPVSGMVESVIAPHLADPLDEPGVETLEIRVFAAGGDAPLAKAALRAHLHRDDHPLGDRYEIPFAPGFQVEAGQSYRFEAVNSGPSAIISSGVVVLTEGDWDNRVTGTNTCQPGSQLTSAETLPSGMYGERDCRGEYAFSTLVNSYDQIMSFPVDDQQKYEHIIESLDIGDYLTIASNRFYDAESRNPLRWPLTTLYYEKLFGGQLGYELAAVFDESLRAWSVARLRPASADYMIRLPG